MHFEYYFKIKKILFDVLLNNAIYYFSVNNKE